jgi:hypothetical protein
MELLDIVEELFVVLEDEQENKTEIETINPSLVGLLNLFFI